MTDDAFSLILAGVICLIISFVLYYFNINTYVLIGWGLCDIFLGLRYRNYAFLRFDKYNILNVEYKEK